jgi:hypothetical protein
MIAQGVSNSVYGMGLMGAKWGDMGIDYQYCVLEAVIKTLGTSAGAGRDDSGSGATAAAAASGGVSSSTPALSGQRRARSNYGGTTPQALANIIYSLGVSGAPWAEFPAQVRVLF